MTSEYATNIFSINHLESYVQKVGATHLRRYGQYFTPPSVASFMAKWVLNANAKGLVLDPALGNGVFPQAIEALDPGRKIIGYEVDSNIIQHFHVPENTTLRFENFLTGDWNESYAGIIGNPPYLKFQLIEERNEVRKSLALNSKYIPGNLSNLYLLFTIKSAQQLIDGGHMAFLIPSDFLDSESGKSLKSILVELELLDFVVQIDDSKGSLFDGVLTSSCILLMSKKQKSDVKFVKVEDIVELPAFENLVHTTIPYTKLDPEVKWGKYLEPESHQESLAGHLGDYVEARRGIATGANDFFLFRESEALKRSLSQNNFRNVVSKSIDVKTSVFTLGNYETNAMNDKLTLLFDPEEPLSDAALSYINEGERLGFSEKYLCAHRMVWYRGERQKPAPIWICQGNRQKIKVVRNIAGVNHLTTFHGIYPLPDYEQHTDGLFALLLSSRAQALLIRASKKMASGLLKFQPKDLTGASFFTLSPIDNRWEIANQLGRRIIELGDLSPSLQGELDLFVERL